MVDPHATTTSGYHLFLEPTGVLRERLSATITELAERYGGPVFPPHVTLLAHIPEGAEAEVRARAQELAQRLTPLQIRLSQPAGEDAYFRNLYLHVLPTEELLQAHDIAEAFFAQNSLSVYMPHLSLVYGTLTAPEQATCIHGLGVPPGESFSADTLHLYKTEGSVSEWKLLESFPLS